MIVWLNGPFGGGKTSTATQLLHSMPDARIIDPEFVGYMLRAMLPDVPTDDFQDWAAWRPLVAATLSEVSSQTGQHLIAPQTVLNKGYLDEIHGAIRTAGLEVRHVVLDAPANILRGRIEASEEARDWRLSHLPLYVEARPWLIDGADLVVDTSGGSPDQVAGQIAASLGIT